MSSAGTRSPWGRTHPECPMTSTLEATRPGQPAAAPSRASRCAGLTRSGVTFALVVLDAALKQLQLPVDLEGIVRIGGLASVIFRLGVAHVVGLVAGLHRRTSVLGAMLWTACLADAVATHVRAGDPLFTNVRI